MLFPWQKGLQSSARAQGRTGDVIYRAEPKMRVWVHLLKNY